MRTSLRQLLHAAIRESLQNCCSWSISPGVQQAVRPEAKPETWHVASTLILIKQFHALLSSQCSCDSTQEDFLYKLSN